VRAAYSTLVRRLFEQLPHAGDLAPGPGLVVQGEAMALDRETEWEKRVPWELLKRGSQLGFRTFVLEEKNGGSGMSDHLTSCLVAEELAAGELGLRVPDDLAVVGFDDIELASYTTPPLTTVSQSASDVGRAAVELLLQRLADPGRPPVRRTLETRLVVRASCGNQP